MTRKNGSEDETMCPCPLCEKSTPSDMNFCIECDGQIKCLECESRLFRGKSYCLKCGKALVSRQESVAQNHFVRTVEGEGATYKEHTELHVTNDAVGIFVPMVLSPTTPGYKLPSVPATTSTKTVDASFEELSGKIPESNRIQNSQQNIDKEQIESNKSSSNSTLASIFQETENGWILYRPEIKALNKADFVRRLTCLFLQFNYERGNSSVPRTEIMNLLTYYGVNDGNTRIWIANEKILMQVTPKDLKLIGPGVQFVQQILGEISDNEKPSGWKIGTKVKRGTRKKKSDDVADDSETNDE